MTPTRRGASVARPTTAAPAGARVATLLAVLLAVLGTVLLGPLPSVAAAPPTRPVARPSGSAPGAGAQDVTVQVDDVTPSAPVRTAAPAPLRITVTLTNTTGAPLTGVRVLGYRGDPIGNQAQLDASLSGATDNGANPLPVPATRPLQVDLPDATPVTAVYTTSTSLLNDGSSGLCLCANAVYPIQLVARAKAGAGDELGRTVTYVPSIYQKAVPTRVSWVWPLIDRPHRLVSDTDFTDDDLAAAVSSGGRLDNALRTIELLKGRVPVTLVVDPELLDELEVMAGGRYTVTTGTGTTARTVPGTGQAVAQAWLQRFALVVAADSQVRVSLTPYADPDVVSLAGQDLSWSTMLPVAMARRVSAALAGRVAHTDVAWPAGGVVDKRVLDSLAASGATTVLLDSTSVNPGTSGGSPVAVARLNTGSGAVTAALTSPAVQTQVAAAVTDDAASAMLPTLAAEVAVRTVQTGNRAASVVMTPPRYADPSPERAARVIRDTSSSAFSTPAAVADLASSRPSTAGRLRAVAGDAGLPSDVLRDTSAVAADLPDVASLLSAGTGTTGSATAAALVSGLPSALQRVTSSAWRSSDDRPAGGSGGAALAARLRTTVEGVLAGVHIVKPASGSYTLGSDNSSLPITVENTHPYAVEVRIAVSASDGLPGYVAKDVGIKRIAAESRQTVQIPSRLERSGRIRVDAQLRTPGGADLGTPVSLSLRSTVFGVIGIAITVGAGGVLVFALVIRFVRRMRRLRRKAAAERAGDGGTPTGRHGSGASTASTSPATGATP